MREKLIELLMDMPYGRGTEEEETAHIESVADYLIENGVTVQEWISVKDRLPDDSTYVLARLSGGAICQALCLTNGSKQWCGAHLERFVNRDTVTHWMPLPPVPEDMK